MSTTRTAKEARKELERRGVSIRQFSRDIGVSERIVYGLLAGRFQGLRGQSHRAAVLLGMKDGYLN